MVTGVKGAIAAALTAAALLVGTLPAVASDPGAQTSGDSLFPDMGNGGYQVLNYSVKLDYAPTTGARNRGKSPLTSQGRNMPPCL